MSKKPRAHTRAGDPSTSFDAARKVDARLLEKQKRVYDIFVAHREMTDLQLQDYCGDAGSTYRTRRAELVALGLLRDSGRKLRQDGSLRIVWEIVE